MNESEVLSNAPKELFIAGAWRPADSTARGSRSRIRRPGEPLCEIADADDGRRAAPRSPRPTTRRRSGRTRPPRERGDILRRAFEMIVERTDELAMLMSLEMGKSLVEARAEVAYANDFLRWFSEEAVRIRGSYSVSPNGRARLLTMRQPVGPCLLITPWNFPLAMGTRKIGPAIAAGCTMVVKPAKQTPLSMLALGEIFERGRPAGRRAEHHHDLAFRRRHRPAVRRPAPAQAVVHRLDRGRPRARDARDGPACCASRWSSAATPRCWSSTTPTSSSPSTRR